jgi:hypothetical protein
MFKPSKQEGEFKLITPTWLIGWLVDDILVRGLYESNGDIHDPSAENLHPLHPL